MTINISSKNTLQLLQFSLLILIALLLLWSKPWTNSNSGDTQKITVTGEATIKADPDEFIFNPYFEVTGTDQASLKVLLTKQTNDAITELKNLGVGEQDIKLDASSYDRWYRSESEDGVLTSSLAITARDSELTQKIQDYLLTTNAKGQITPQASFSDTKKKELDMLAIDQALDDAKEKAKQQTAKFDSKVGKVIEIRQQQASDFPAPNITSETDISAGSEVTKLPVLSGQNEYKQHVTVTFELQ